MPDFSEPMDGFKHRRVHLHKNQSLYDAGEPSNGFYRVETGCIRLQDNRGDGERQIIAFCFPGDVFGLESGGPRLHAAESTAPTQLTAFSTTNPDRLNGGPGNGADLASAACEMISTLSTHIKGLGLTSAEDRVLWFLDWLAHDQRICCSGGVILLPMNRGDIADFLNLAPETLSRTISRLVDRRRIRLIDSRRIQLRPPAQAAGAAQQSDTCRSSLVRLTAT